MHGTLSSVRKKERWPVLRADRLKELWNDDRNLSAAVVSMKLSTEFKTKISRSAVLSKVARAGLVGRRQWGVNRGGRNPNGGVTHAVIPWPRHPDASKAFGAPVTVLGLTNETCRWPVGDPKKPDFIFCGAKPFGKFVYCECHARVAYPQIS